jgi:hypothetical protein
MTDKQPEALRLADEVDKVAQTFPDMAEVSAMLRTQHAAIERKDALLRRMVDVWDEPERSLTACYGVVQAIKQELSQ